MMNKLDKLLPYIIGREAAIFMGAGFSNIAGCARWDEIVDNFKKLGFLSAHTFPNDNDYTLAIEYAYRELNKINKSQEYIKIIRKGLVFDDDKFRNNYKPLISSLRQIKPFPSIITTNVDETLTRTDYDFFIPLYKQEDLMYRNLIPGNVFHIHGYIEDLDKSIFRRSQYIKHYKGLLDILLEEVFLNKTVLFLGYSFKDKEIRDALLMAKGKSERIHYRLMPEEDEITDEESFLELYGVETIIYGKRETFPEVLSHWITKHFCQTSISQELLPLI